MLWITFQHYATFVALKHFEERRVQKEGQLLIFSVFVFVIVVISLLCNYKGILSTKDCCYIFGDSLREWGSDTHNYWPSILMNRYVLNHTHFINYIFNGDSFGLVYLVAKSAVNFMSAVLLTVFARGSIIIRVVLKRYGRGQCSMPGKRFCGHFFFKQDHEGLLDLST